MCPPGLHITLGIFFRLFTLLENACHELDVRGLLQGGGSEAYQEYVTAFRKDEVLAEKCADVKDEMEVLDQLVSFITLTASVSATPFQIGHLGQLQSALSTKKKELKDLVIKKVNTPTVPFNNFYSGNRERAAPGHSYHFLQKGRGSLCECPGQSPAVLQSAKASLLQRHFRWEPRALKLEDWLHNFIGHALNLTMASTGSQHQYDVRFHGGGCTGPLPDPCH